jgi:hypothetical protein
MHQGSEGVLQSYLGPTFVKYLICLRDQVCVEMLGVYG